MGSQSSGEAGIRTLDPLAWMPVFKTGAIGRSATSPGDAGGILLGGKFGCQLPPRILGPVI